jgi:DNA repair protein RadA/Sms
VARRLAEAARLGFTKALVPPDSGELPAEVRHVVVPDLGSALAELEG